MAVHSQMPDKRNAYRMLNPYADTHDYVNTFTAIVGLSRSNFSIAHAPLFQLKSAT